MSEFIPADVLEGRKNPNKMVDALFGLGVFKGLGISEDWKTIKAEIKITGAIDLFKLKRFFEFYLGRHYRYTKVIIHPDLLIVELEAED